MKFLASGYQYKVYDIGNGRLLKKTQPYFYTFVKVMEVAKKQEGASFFKSLVIAYKAGRVNKKSLKIMKEKLKVVPGYLFANPEFIGNSLNFTQDKVVTLEKYLKENTTEDRKAVIEKYVELQKIFWSYGIHDAVYKFQPNYGVDKNGRVVCIDLGEFVFNKDDAIKSIGTKKWLTRPSYKKWPEGELKKYYTDLMTKNINEDELKKNWCAHDNMCT